MPYTRDRHIFEIRGHDRARFLQGLVTNDVSPTPKTLTYSAILTPQGKFVTDFFLLQDDEVIYMDVAGSAVSALATRLNMYKLRADVTIGDSSLKVFCGTGPAPQDAVSDPRDPTLGWRLYGDHAGNDGSDWTPLRVAARIPAVTIELTGDSYILENGFERLHGVDFKKGCYVGQEITARMKHKATLRKGLAQVRVDGHAPFGTDIVVQGKNVGALYSQSGGLGLAYLRFDRATDQMQAGSARVRYEPD